MAHRITGSLRIEDRTKGRVWVAAYIRADGTKTRKTLGLAWVKDSGRKTARGATVWRAADGPKPDPRYLTPREAQEALDALLVAERAKPVQAVAPAARGKTFGEAAAEWLEDVEHVRGVAPTTLASYRTMVGRLHAEAFPPELALRRIDVAKVDSYQRRLLTQGKLGRDSVRRRMIVLRGVLGRARRLRWIATNPVLEIDVVAQPKPSPDFNVLQPAEVEAVAAAIESLPDRVALAPDPITGQRNRAVMIERHATYAEAVRLAAYTGVRLGELRALRWRNVDWQGRSLHVSRNAPTSAPSGAEVRAPKSGRGRAVPLTDQAHAVLRRLADRDGATGPDDLVLPTRLGGMLQAKRVRGAFYGGVDAAGLGHLRDGANPITFHDLRHTFGTLAVRKVPVTDVQAYMGHADIDTTMRYVHHEPRHDAARRLTEAFDLEDVA